MSLGRKLVFSIFSSAGTMTSMLKATASPSASPARVPITPATAPCTMKMPMMLRGLAPSVRKMAMSARLSCTVMTSVLTRLKAATATMRVRMMAIMRFSICTAAYQVRFWRGQSSSKRRPVSVPASSCVTCGAWRMSCRRTRTPVGPSWRKMRRASSR